MGKDVKPNQQTSTNNVKKGDAYIFDFVHKSVNVLDRLWDIVFI